MRGLQSVIFLACTCVAVEASASLEPHQFTGYRLLQYDEHDEQLGSRRTAFDGTGAAVPADEIFARARELRRKILVLPFADLSETAISDLNRVAPSIGGVVLVLPETSSGVDQATLSRWRGMEQALLKGTLDAPIYFAFENDRIREIYASLKDGGNDDFRLLSINEPEQGKPILLTTMNNFQGWLAGSADDRQSRTLAVVAHYDSLAMAPALAGGADANGSGVLALLELSRLFGSLYQTTRSHGEFNLLFVLTAAGHLQYLGARRWLDNADASLLATIDFVLCLDSIGKGDQLYFHSAKPATATGMKKFYGAFADVEGVEVEAVHRRINVTEGLLHWEHEAFVYKRIPAATLSRHKEPPPVFGRSSVFDTPETVDMKVLARNIKFVAEAISRLVYDSARDPAQSKLEVFTGSLAVDPHFLNVWGTHFSKSPRFAPLLKKEGPLLSEMYSFLQTHTHETNRLPFEVDDEFPYTFYTGTTATIESYRVKSIIVDLALSVAIVAYCTTLYLVFRFMVVGFEAFSVRSLKRTFLGGKGKKA